MGLDSSVSRRVSATWGDTTTSEAPVKIQEAEAGLITDYTVCPTRVPDQELWAPALTRHQELFGRPPKLAVADGGFASAANERTATERGVEKVALPRPRGRPAPTANPPPPRPRW